MRGKYIVRDNGALLEFSDWDHIPMEFDNMICFRPDWPEPPHTEEEHEIMATYNDKLVELMKRERK